MGVMGKFRDNTGVILWILIGSFGLLWVVMDVFDPNALSMAPRSLGSVNGETISFDEYNSRVQYYSNAYSQQTGSSMTAETRAIYESQVWDELVSSKLLEQKMDELGITVSDQELLDMVYGDNPDPLIRQYFAREDGSIDPFIVQNVLSSGEYTQEAIAIELQLRQKRRQEKLRNFITAGLQVTDKEIMEEFDKRNTFASVSFVRFPYSEVDDSELSISDSEVQDYYNANKERYKRNESYRAQYVAFSTLPTSSDTAAIIEEVQKLVPNFETAENDSVFLVQMQSSTRFNNVFVKKSEIREEYAPVLDVSVGEVTEPINLGGSVAVIKKIAEKGDEIKFGVMSRIFEALPSTVDNAAREADDFEFYASEETSFEDESERLGLTVMDLSATKGNTFISGLGSSQQTMNFLEGADEGDISTPIELGTQFIVIKMTQKTKEGYRPLEEVRSQIETQVKNEKRKEITAEKVAGLLSANSGLAALAEADGKTVMDVDNLAKSSTVISGGGREPKVIGSIFGLQQGTVSSPIKGAAAVYVVEVKSITEPSTSTLDEATASTIRGDLEQKLNERYLSVWLDELKKEADIEDNRSRLVR